MLQAPQRLLPPCCAALTCAAGVTRHQTKKVEQTSALLATGLPFFCQVVCPFNSTLAMSSSISTQCCCSISSNSCSLSSNLCNEWSTKTCCSRLAHAS